MTNVKEIYPDFMTLEDAFALDEETAIANQYKYQNEFRTKFAQEWGMGICAQKAEGCYLWDMQGRKHLDFGCAVGVYSLGFNNPWLIEHIKKFYAGKKIVFDPMSIRLVTSSFAKNMSLVTPELTKTVVAGGGGMEANETMLKMAKVASYRTKKGKSRMISMDRSFHGKSQGTLGVSGQEGLKAFQGPPVPGTTLVPYGDLVALEAELSKGDVIAVLAETLQCNDFVVPPENYFYGVRELCDKYDAYMLLDEVQCGGCRTGEQWAFQYYPGLVPDAFSWAKGMSGGILPASGCQAKESLYLAAYGAPESCALHTATFQDNNVSGAAALGALQFMIENNVAEKFKTEGAYFISKLNEIQAKYPDLLTEVKGRGYCIGLVIADNKDGESYAFDVINTMSNKHLIHITTCGQREEICKIYPNYATTREDFDWFLNALDDTLKEIAAKM